MAAKRWRHSYREGRLVMMKARPSSFPHLLVTGAEFRAGKRFGGIMRRAIWLALHVVTLSVAILNAAPSQAAGMVAYDFSFAYTSSNNPLYQVGSVGSGRLGFYEQGEADGTQLCNCGVNAYYQAKPYFLDVSYGGVTHTVISSQFPSGYGVLMQDIPTQEVTYDLFRMENLGARFSIFAPSSTITDYALTQSNVDKMWASHNFAYFEPNTLGSDQASAQITSFRLVSPVPEPATWASMLIGFGAIGFMLRRRKKNRTITRSLDLCA